MTAVVDDPRTASPSHLPAPPSAAARATTTGNRDARDRALLLRYRRDGDLGARDELVERYEGFSRSLARRFARHGEPIADLEQVAAIGLLKAIGRYDLDRTVSITTFAMPTIVGELRRHYRDRVWSVHVARGIQELGVRVARADAEITGRLGHHPSLPDLAIALERSLADVTDAADAMSSRRSQRLWEPGDDGPDPLGLDDPAFAAAEMRATLVPALRALPARDRRLLHLRFTDGLTQSEIADEVGISQMHVSRLLRRALDELSTAVER
jgi:RNA polymerase sigma-B factor